MGCFPISSDWYWTPIIELAQQIIDAIGAVLGWLFSTARRRSIFTYVYLLLGVIVMFGPVLWLVMSSFKSARDIQRFPPRFLPYHQELVALEGFDEPLPLYNVTLADGTIAQLVQKRRVGLEAQMIDPTDPEAGVIKVKLNERAPVENVRFSLDNYTRGIESFNFWRYLANSVIVTASATILTLFVNSMAAFALSKYRFRGRGLIFMLIISTLMVPLSVILVPAFLLITALGWNNQLIGIIIPTIGTPTGVFLLRQYMLTIPDELLDSARIDGATEWRIYWQVILPLAAPALAVLAIFSTIWRWNDFLWPKIVMTRNEMFTLQVGLETFQGRSHGSMGSDSGDDGADGAADHVCLRLLAEVHHHRHRDNGNEIGADETSAFNLKKRHCTGDSRRVGRRDPLGEMTRMRRLQESASKDCGMLPPRIVVIGAGSAIFGLGALSTIIQHPAMKGAELALCDINAEGLGIVRQLAEKMNRAWDAFLRITSSTKRRELLPDGIAEMCRRELSLSEMYVEAGLRGDRQLALQALLLDPMVTDIDTARAILDDLLVEFAEYLPQFD